MTTSVEKEQSQLKMTFIQPSKVKSNVIQVNLNKMRNIDIINWHKKTRDIVFHGLLHIAVDNKKVKNNILKLEN